MITRTLIFLSLFSVYHNIQAMNEATNTKENEEIISEIKMLNLQDREKFLKSNFTLLMSAAYHNHIQATQLLLSQGEDVNAKDSDGTTPLMFACEKGNMQIAQLLLQVGADVKAKMHEDSASPLIYACRGGHDLVAELLIDKGALINDNTNFGTTPLILASKLGHYKIVKLLLDKGAEVNTQDQIGNSALIAACERGNALIAKLLLDNGAHINAQNNRKNNSLMIAARNGHNNIIELLLTLEVNVNATNIDGWTSLMEACANGHFKTVMLLLENAADCNAVDKDNTTPLMLAAENGCTQSCKLLIDKGADIHATRIGKVNALMLATRFGHTQVVKLLLERDANINARDNYGLTALLLAIQYEYHRIARLLLDKDAYFNDIDINTISLTDNKMKHLLESLRNQKSLYLDDIKNVIQGLYKRYNKQTLLMWATMKGDLATVKFILNQHPPSWYINAQDDIGFTALHYATWLNRKVILFEFINYWRDLDQKLTATEILKFKNLILLKNNDQKTAIQLALDNHKDDLAIRLMQELPKIHIPLLLKTLEYALYNKNQNFINYWIANYFEPKVDYNTINDYFKNA